MNDLTRQSRRREAILLRWIRRPLRTFLKMQNSIRLNASPRCIQMVFVPGSRPGAAGFWTLRTWGFPTTARLLRQLLMIRAAGTMLRLIVHLIWPKTDLLTESREGDNPSMRRNSGKRAGEIKTTQLTPPQLVQQATEIRFQFGAGNFRPFAVPRAFAELPLVAGQYFYTVPTRLWDSIVQSIGGERFDPQLFEMERQLSLLVGDHSFNVGIRRKAPIAYDLLEPSKPLTIPFEQVKQLNWGKSEADIKEIERVGSQRLAAVGEPIRGYCGWLMTSRAFIDEHDQLLHQHRDHVREHDFPKPILASFGQRLPEARSDEPWVAAFLDFYGRWRLQSLNGPGLPRPLPALLASFPAVAQSLAAAEGGTSLFLPDILPVSTRGVLPAAIEDAVHARRASEHLAQWKHIIRRQNPAKNAIARYGRLFSLQHYLRTIHARHQDAVHRNKARLVTAFASYFHVSDDSIQKDLMFITRQLGKDWERRPDPLA